MITILGRAKHHVIEKLTGEKDIRPNEWFFIDYASKDVGLETHFDVLLKGEEKELIPSAVSITVSHCINQFGHFLSGIPSGWKTICRLVFDPDIPEEIFKLREIGQWKYNSDAITLAEHAEIRWSSRKSDQYELYFFLFNNLKNKLEKSHRHSFRKLEIITLFIETYQAKPEQAMDAITTFIQLGKMKSIHDDLIEFA